MYGGGRSTGHLEFLDLLLRGQHSSSEHRNGSNGAQGVACLLTLSSAWRLRSLDLAMLRARITSDCCRIVFPVSYIDESGD